MRFSEADGHKIVSTSTAGTVGKVSGFVVDPATRSVRALEVRKADSGDVLLWSRVTRFGPDAVTVAGPDAITEADEDVTRMRGKDHQLVGKRVLSTEGDELGTVTDVVFDGDSGAVNLLELGEVEVAGVRLRGVGSYAVVVTAE